MSKKLMTGLLALVALAAMALPAVASASPEIGETSGSPATFTRLATGVAIRGTNVGETLMTNAAGEVLTRCNAATLNGTLKKNTGTEMEGEITEATFTGSGTESRCTATFGNSIVTTKITNGLPWCIKATSSLEPDELQLAGGSCGSPRAINFALDVIGGLVTCVYERETKTSPVVGSFTTDISGQDAVGTITKQKFTRISGSTSVCPSEGYLDMSFTLETTNGTPLYIK